MNPYQRLANAVIENAAKDYRKAFMYHLKFPCSRDYSGQVSEIECFFRSEWFCALTNLDGEYLIIRIRDIVTREMSI